uniref:Uncharacterized protein n=1 Tax=Candidatus Kentrum sp. TUN TaxID=2126343 RepID=A0A450ZW92_9GAMM|nr:MAG: hypothetical protein BECKTUN1418D_GA0071000_10752 [Candidatus Kentron sp. TUN]
MPLPVPALGTNMVVMNSAFSEASRSDMRSLTPISLSVMLVVLVLVLIADFLFLPPLSIRVDLSGD